MDSMRARLVAAGMPGENVDLPDVKANFDALGLAIFNIMMIAQSRSDPTVDPAFWQWVTDLNSWAISMSAWQAAVKQAVSSWTPSAGPEQSFRTALLKLASPPPPPQAPPQSVLGEIL
jgi:hypothetical protein